MGWTSTPASAEIFRRWPSGLTGSRFSLQTPGSRDSNSHPPTKKHRKPRWFPVLWGWKLLPVLGHFLHRHRIEEGHRSTQLLAHNFNRVLGFGFAESQKLLASGILIGEKALGESA